jgi:hypothetical protein
MKIFALVAAAAASTTEWVMSDWWKNAQAVYDFAANNNADFTARVNSVPNHHFQPLFAFCGGADDQVTGAEMAACGAKMAKFVGMSEGSQNYLYDFGEKYWSVVDGNADGSLNFGEFKQAISALAATNAQVAIDGFDANGNNVIDGTEKDAFYQAIISQATGWGWSVTDEQWAALKTAYNEANVGNDMFTLYEIAIFELAAGNVFLG